MYDTIIPIIVYHTVFLAADWFAGVQFIVNFVLLKQTIALKETIALQSIILFFQCCKHSIL